MAEDTIIPLPKGFTKVEDTTVPPLPKGFTPVSETPITKPDVKKSPYTPYFNQKFKEFGGTDQNSDDYTNILAAQKAGEATISYKENSPSLTAEDIQLEAVNTIKKKEAEIKNYQNIVAKNKQNYKPTSGGVGAPIAPPTSVEIDPYNLEETIALESKDLEELKGFYQQELSKKILYGYQDNIDEFLPEISKTLQPKNLLDVGITLNNVGDLKKQRALKTIAESERPYTAYDLISGQVQDGQLTENKYKMSDIDRAYYTYVGGESQKESLKFSIKEDQLKTAQIDKAILDYNEQLGDNIETEQDREYINKLKEEKKRIVNAELQKTQLIDQINTIVETQSKPYIEYKKVKDLQNGLSRDLLVPDVLRTVNDLLTTTQVGSANLVEKLSFDGSQEEYDILSEELESRKNRVAAQAPGIIKGTISSDTKSSLSETPFYFDEEGKFRYDLRLLPALATRTTLESMAMGSGAALASPIKNAVLRKTAQAGLMYIPSASIFGDRILRGEELKGLPKDQTQAVAATLVLVEVGSELVNPLEIEFFTGKPTHLTNLSINDAQRLAYKEGIRKITGSNKYDKLIDLITDSKVFTKEAFKQGNMEYLEEAIGSLGKELTNYITTQYNPEYQGESELNIQDQLVSYLSTMVGMFPMASISGYREVKNANKTALFMAGSNPEAFLQGIKTDLQKGTISQEEATRRLNLVKDASLTYTTLTDQFNKIDQLTTKSGQPVEQGIKENLKYDLFNANYNLKSFQENLLKAPTDKEKEAAIKEIEEATEQVAEITQKVSQPVPDVSLETKQKNLLNETYSDKYINSLTNPANISQEIATLEQEKSRFSLDIQAIYDQKIEKLNKRIGELSKYSTLLESLKKDIQTLSKEEINKELETALNKEGLSEQEQEEYYNLLSDKLDNLDKEENTVTFKAKGEKTFTLGELVTYQGSNYIVKKDEQGNPYLENDVTKAKVIPSDVNDFTKYTPKDTKPKEGEEENLDDIFGKRNPSKEDVEKRRQEDLDLWSKLSTGESYTTLRKKLGLPETGLAGGAEATRLKEAINAKYDAELAALEQEKSSDSLTKDKKSQGISLQKTEEELKEELNKLEEKLTASVIEDVAYTKEDFEKLVTRVAELRKLLNIAPPKEDTTEKDKKEEQEKANKIAESKLQKVYYPFSTTPQQSTSTGVANEPFMQAQANTLAKIREKAETKSFEEQGIFITVMNNSFPIDERHQQDNVINAYKLNKLSDARIKAGRIAVFTNKEGTPLFFDIEGNPSTSEKGFPVYQPLRGRLEGGKLDMSKQNIPTQTELKESGELERFNKDIEKLTQVRTSTEPLTFQIEEITKGVTKIEDSPEIKIDFNKYDIAVNIRGLVKALDKETKQVYPVYRKTVQEAGLTDFVNAFMNVSNKEGLPDGLKDSWLGRRDLLEKIIYTHPSTRRIRANEERTQMFLTSSEDVATIPINVDVKLFNQPITLYSWNGKSFSPIAFQTYQDFLSDNLTMKKGEVSSFNSYIKLGDPIIKDVKPIEEAPKTEVKSDTPLREFKKSDRAKGIKINKDNKGLGGLGKKDDLKRVKLLGKKVTEAQNNQAKLWFDTYLKNSGANFEDLRAIVNSDAYATWSASAIKLWQGGDFTDLYHEAFHDFTQLFLTKEQKQSLYSEIRKDKPNLSDFQVEELLAEDFRKYMLSGQKLILNNRVKRNTIFRRMYNFLKELFTGTPPLEVIYQKLANGNVSSYKRNLDNALFGVLNKNVEGLTFNESINLYRALDSLIAKQFRAFGLSISKLFKDKKYIEGAYQQVALDLEASLKQNEEDYNSLVEKYNNSDELEKQSLLPELTELQKLVDNTAFVLEHFDEVRAKHLQESEFLKISKKFVPEEIIDELDPNTKDSIYDDKEIQSARDRTSDQLIYLLATLPKYINKEGNKVEKWNDFISNIEDITEFDLAWNRLAKALTGERDYKTMIDKIIKLTETNPEYQALLEALPNPDINGAELSLLEMQLRNQFINTFSQPYIPLKFVNWWKDKSNNQLRISTKEAIGRSYSLLEADWDENIQSIPNPYRILDAITGQQSIDMEAIVKEFEGISGLRPKRREQFLQALGFSFSPQTLESPEYHALIKDGRELSHIYEAIKYFVNLKNGILSKGVELTDAQIEELKKPVVSLIKTIEKTIYLKDRASLERVGKALPLMKGQKENIESIQKIEIDYSDKYFSDNVLNSENSNVWAIRPWSQQSVLYSYLNNPKFETYTQLINDPVGAYFDIKKNPDADNIYLNAVFDIHGNKNRREHPITKEPVKIKLINHNGLTINFGEDTKGNKTTSLTRFEKLVQDIAPLLLSGNKEHIRYGDKTTSNGTEVIFSRISEGSENPYLPVDIKSFRETFLPVEVQAIFRRILHSALLQTNQYFTQGIGKNFDNFNKNLENKEYWGYFDGILSKETKDKLLEDGLITKPLDIYELIDNNWNDIALNLHDFLKADVKAIQKELSANNILSISDYIPNDLLLRGQYGENNTERYETLTRAFAINSYILNLEHTRLMFQDPRFYANKNKSYREAFKRFSKTSSTGTIGVNDDQQNEFLQNTRLEKKQYDLQNPDNKSPNWVETGVENSAIFDDVKMKAEDFLAEVKKIYKGKPLEEQLAVAKAYEDITTTDAFGFCTFDWYRIWQIRTGNDNWNNEKEELYKKIVTKQPVSEDENLKAFLFFPPLKIRVVGHTFDYKQNRFIPIDYKFAVSPLLPNLVKDKAFQAVKDNMLRQNISLGLFKSGSKHSAITDNGNNNKFYNPDGSVNVSDYTINPIFTEFIFEVVPSPTDYKEEVSFSTQLRKLLFVNQFNKGYPIDYKEKNWDSLSEAEKLKASKIYRLEQEFGNTISTLVNNEKEKLLKQLDATVDEKGNFIINEQKLSDLLEDEFNKRGLPYNVLKSIQTVDGKFKYALDASLQRETIEQVLLSIVDNRLRKQKGLGESLIQASSIGYESLTFDRVDTWNSINGNDLPFYQYNEGKPTSPQKVKIALQGDFKKLLNLPQVVNLSKKDNLTPLEALNQLLRDNEFSKTITDLITITGVRIPVQGHNSMEFMEVAEFLPEEAGSVIIVSPALVAKSGGDFDWDKITSLYTSFNVTEQGTLIYPNQSEQTNKHVYKELKKEFEDRIENKPDFYNNIIQSIFGISPEQLQEELLSEDIFQKKEVPPFSVFNRLQVKKALNNKLNSIIRQVLEQPEMFEQLVTPNSTYLFEPIADQRQEALSKSKPSYSDIPKVQESLNQFESNTVGKQSLGIGAIWNTLFAQMQKAGVTLEKTYITNITGKKPTTKFTANRLPHNHTKEGNVSLSGLFSQPYNDSKFLISETISQLMNGWVDVAKKDWIFYINGRKEIAPTLLYAATTGIHKDILIGFFNQPVIYDFVKNYQKYKSSITKFKDPELTRQAKKNAIVDTLKTWFPEDYGAFLNEMLSGEDWEFWTYLAKDMRTMANENKEAFNPEAFMKFAIPVDGKLEKPTSEQEKLNQALYLIQFLEFQEQGGIVEKLRRVVNQDTEKPVNIQYSKERQVRRAELKEYNLIPEKYIEKMANESVIRAFTHSKTGLDKFIQNLTDQTFEVTNHPIFNRFLYEEFNKPTEKNNIPFQIKFDIYEDWVKAVKNQFTEYLYQNYVYFPNTTEKVATKYFKEWSKPSTALALRLDNIKQEYPDLLENNLLLQFLIRDNSREKVGGKPKVVNLKLRKDRIDNTTSNALTEAFEQLYNSPIPEVAQFAKDLAHFAFIQSGLSKSPISFSNIIPQEYYGGDISDVIHAFHNLLNESPQTAKSQLERFYNDFFKKYNRKFFISQETQEIDPETGKFLRDVDFEFETHRGKDYTDREAYDLLSKKQNISIKKQQDFLDSIKSISQISTTPFTETTAKDNPSNFYIYEFNESGGGKLGSSKVRGDVKNPEPNTAPIILMKQARVEGGNWTDDTYAKNINLINTSISEAIAKIQNLKPNSIIFPTNLTEFSKLKEFAPKTAEYLHSQILDKFGLDLNEVKFEEVKTESQEKQLPSSQNTEMEEARQLSGRNTEEIYNQLGIKTASEHVKIVSNPLEYKGKGVIAYRDSKNPNHLGNPFGTSKSSKFDLIPRNTVKESVQSFIDWITTDKYKDVQPQRREYVIDNLRKGTWKGQNIYYYKELNEPSHATALDYLINKYNWEQQNKPEEDNKDPFECK